MLEAEALEKTLFKDIQNQLGKFSVDEKVLSFNLDTSTGIFWLQSAATGDLYLHV